MDHLPDDATRSSVALAEPNPHGDGGRTLDFTPDSSASGSRTSASGPGRTTVIIAAQRGVANREGLRFELLEELGRGGMGVVLRGRDPDLHREVAVKILRHAGDDRREARFLAEAQITGQLEHPNIIPVHEFGRDREGRPWFAMKLVNGRTMGDLLTARANESAVAADWPLARLVGVLIQVCHGVAFAHSRGVIHRDLKPANIMLGDFGEVLVVDWGLGKALGASQVESIRGDLAGEGTEAHLTVDGAIVGTPCYMPPEQARGELDRLGPAGDIFALGASLCEILTGRPPITGTTVSEVVRKACDGEAVIPVRDWRGRRIPRELTAIIRRAMDPVPEGRYPSCEALADDLQRWLDHRAVSVVDASPWEVVQKIVRRHRLAVGIAAAASVALVAALTGGYLLKERERATAVAARQLAERALAQAEAQRRSAETGRRRERALASGSERQARRLERSRTVALLAQAEVALQRGRGGDAASILGEVAPEERDWTWRHLQARVAGSGDAQLSGRPDDRLVAAGAGFLVVSADGRLRLTSTAGQDRALAPLGRPVTSVAADPAGTSVVVGSATGGHLVLDGATGRMTASRLGGGVSRLVAVADGLVLSAQAQDVRWNGPGDQGERPWSQVAALTVSPDRGWWAVALPGSVVVHPMNEPERRLSAPERIDRLAASRDGTHLAAIGGARLRIWALPAGAIEADLTPGPELTAAAYAEGGVIALGTGQGEVLLWDPEVGLPLARLAAGQGAVADLAWTADGRALGARLADGSIRIWRE